MALTADEAWLIAGMCIATFGVRFPVLLLAGRLALPESVQRALRYVPVAVLTAIAVPMLVKPEGAWAIHPANSYLVAGVIAIATSALSRHLLMTIVVGMTVFAFLRW